MPKKYYAVRQGKNKGIFSTWEECQANTKGYSGAEFKSFKTLAEAEAYMNTSLTSPMNQHINGDAYLKEDQVDEGIIARAYVDGSYDHGTKRYAGGAVILIGEEEVHIYEAGDDVELAAMRNVAGELLGAIRAMEWVHNHKDAMGIEKLIIYHDYEGIAKWATKRWQAKKKGTQEYVTLFNKFSTSYKIEFIKVLGHSGDYYNELADHLAKKALGIEKSS
ncbi:ribonuclease H family protein [Petrocella sp. FN5]|uniref:ribonuclease H family protein n=1 Tax=Petrocella sp. FN5 TaxID=3032002 RepID=UPI0023DA3A92|nr:ribonuclease H family protein [Petrocella sp. FN5]MDF1618056.1 ribonuclease H family protein [Petrocella sp. FN5]